MHLGFSQLGIDRVHSLHRAAWLRDLARDRRWKMEEIRHGMYSTSHFVSSFSYCVCLLAMLHSRRAVNRVGGAPVLAQGEKLRRLMRGQQ